MLAVMGTRLLPCKPGWQQEDAILVLQLLNTACTCMHACCQERWVIRVGRGPSLC